MNKSITILPLLAGFLIACGTTEEVIEENVEETKPIKSLVIGDPFDCGIPDMLVFPVGTATYAPEVTGVSKYDLSGTGAYSLTTTDANGSTMGSGAYADIANISSFGFATNAASSGLQLSFV
jgi:hypothetical protein